jgi:hypothetical protein
MTIPAAPRATVWIGPHTAIVKTALGEAIVKRSPFRIAFEDARGNPVLREARPTNRTLAINPPPLPPLPGYGPPLHQTLYAPLEFTVGVEHDFARASGTWTGEFARQRSQRYGLQRASRALDCERRKC